MKMLFMRLALITVSLLTFSLPVSAGQLDDYYLRYFGELPGSAIQKAVLFPAVAPAGPPQCGTPVKHGLSHNWHKLEPATRKILAKQLAAPVLSGESQYASSGGHFLIHYATTGSDTPAPPAGYNLSGWLQQIGDVFESVYAQYTTAYGYLPPPVFGRYDIYLRDLVPFGIYGQTSTGQAFPTVNFPYAYSSYIEIDKDFTNNLYTKSNLYFPVESLQITAAHEFQHAIQYGYNYYFDIWYAEATSTWYEDELYDGINQLYGYIPNWFSNSLLALDTTTDLAAGGGYGRWIFNRYLAEQHGTSIVRRAWEHLASLSPSTSPTNSSGDIRMAPVLNSLLQTPPYNSSLGSDFFGFAKRVYIRDWNAATVSHPQEVYLVHPYAPALTFGNYPAAANRAMERYSFAFFRLTPSATVPTMILNLARTSGIRTALFKKTAGSLSEITANNDGSYTVTGFGLMSPAFDEVVLLAVNTTDVDNHQISFSTNGNPVTVTEPVITSTSGGGGGGGGCFIATAAYGSYLHPQVRVLRDFRDNYLLANAAGRTFVALYYRVSPPLADFIARHELLRGMTRLALTPVVAVVAHPVSSGTALLLAAAMLYLPLRRRYKAGLQISR